jgi:hypothetical protein
MPEVSNFWRPHRVELQESATHPLFLEASIFGLELSTTTTLRTAQVLNMSSQTPDPAAPEVEVKEEESAVVVDTAGTPTPAPSTTTGLTKQDYDTMRGILDRLTNYRDEEYVCAFLFFDVFANPSQRP